MPVESIYHQIGQRTDGNIYLGVIGPVRTGKSTFIKRFMEELVIPNIENVYRRERARDELPQSGSGRTIMTAEPKFIPEEAVQIAPDSATTLSIRLIDSVGYMVDSAVGSTEEGKPRMVTTPWFDHEIPMAEAPELGTKKVMEDHCTIGIVVTTDGSITDIPREDYAAAEARAITDMTATGKPFLVLVNSAEPQAAPAQAVCRQLESQFGVTAMAVNAQTLTESRIQDILNALLQVFPVRQMEFYFPRWVDALPAGHPIKAALYDAVRSCCAEVRLIRDTGAVTAGLAALEQVQSCSADQIDLGCGIVSIAVQFPEALFYRVLGEQSGLTIENDGDLLRQLSELSAIRREYEKIAAALSQVRATGYGIVMPAPEEMSLDQPEIIHKGGSYGVRLRASAPSIHMMRADIVTELSPMVGDEKQSEDLLNYLLSEFEGNTEKLWESNIFGKSLFELVNEGLNAKLTRMPDDARAKLRETLQRIINEGSGGLICIIL